MSAGGQPWPWGARLDCCSAQGWLQVVCLSGGRAPDYLFPMAQSLSVIHFHTTLAAVYHVTLIGRWMGSCRLVCRPSAGCTNRVFGTDLHRPKPRPPRRDTLQVGLEIGLPHKSKYLQATHNSAYLYRCAAGVCAPAMSVEPP